MRPRGSLRHHSRTMPCRLDCPTSSSALHAFCNSWPTSIENCGTLGTRSAWKRCGLALEKEAMTAAWWWRPPGYWWTHKRVANCSGSQSWPQSWPQPSPSTQPPAPPRRRDGEEGAWSRLKGWTWLGLPSPAASPSFNTFPTPLDKGSGKEVVVEVVVEVVEME